MNESNAGLERASPSPLALSARVASLTRAPSFVAAAPELLDLALLVTGSEGGGVLSGGGAARLLARSGLPEEAAPFLLELGRRRLPEGGEPFAVDIEGGQTGAWARDLRSACLVPLNLARETYTVVLCRRDTRPVDSVALAFILVAAERAQSQAELASRVAAGHAAAQAAGGLAHQVNNLLGGMLGLTTLAPTLEPQALEALAARLSERIEHASRLAQVVLAITRYAKRSEGEELSELTSRTRDTAALAIACGSGSVSVDVDVPEGELWGCIPPVPYTRLVLSLILDGLERLGDATGARMTVSLRREGPEAVLAIETRSESSPPPEEPASPLGRAVAQELAASVGAALAMEEEGGQFRCTLRLAIPGVTP